MKVAEQFIPEQTEGKRTDFANSVTRETIEAAHKLFKNACQKLLNISQWHDYSGPGSSKFGLTDEHGNLLERLARKGDYFYIDLPAPGSRAGKGFEWVVIEDVISGGTKTTTDEFLMLIVRPVPNPATDSTEIAHFFSAASTSTFIVERHGLKVSAEVHGRNEKPNNKHVNLYDTIRNTAIALSARTGLSGPQWKKLVLGLLQ